MASIKADSLHYNRLIRPVSDEATVNKLLAILVELTPEQQRDMWFRDARAGAVCLFSHESATGLILEYVQGSRDDSISTLYTATDLFRSRQALIDARNTMMTEIAATSFSLPGAIGYYDEGREREVSLKEMGTAQLIDQWARLRGVSLGGMAA